MRFDRPTDDTAAGQHRSRLFFPPQTSSEHTRPRVSRNQRTVSRFIWEPRTAWPIRFWTAQRRAG
jgi:hypothetical protein